MSNVPANSSKGSNVSSPSYSHKGYPQGSAQCLVLDQETVQAAIPVGAVLVEESIDKQRCAVGNSYIGVGSAIVSPGSSAPSTISTEGACGDLRSIIQLVLSHCPILLLI